MVTTNHKGVGDCRDFREHLPGARRIPVERFVKAFVPYSEYNSECDKIIVRISADNICEVPFGLNVTFFKKENGQEYVGFEIKDPRRFSAGDGDVPRISNILKHIVRFEGILNLPVMVKDVALPMLEKYDLDEIPFPNT